jgi:hypothetical protein
VRLIDKVQKELPANSLGLTMFITDLNTWKNEYVQYMSDKRRLWIFLMPKVAPLLQAKIELDQKFTVYRNTYETFDLWILFK